MTSPLLDGKFAPVTDSFGFLNAPFDTVSVFFFEWVNRRRPYTRRTLKSGLEASLTELGCGKRGDVLLAQTRSDWVGVFVDREDSYHSEIGHPTRVMRCPGVNVRWFPHTISQDRRSGQYGAITFALTDNANNIERVIDLMHDEHRWHLTLEGDSLPFEGTEQYGARKVTDRFTPEMLEAYCQAIGIDVFNPDFYGPAFDLFQEDKSPQSGPVATPLWQWIRTQLSRNNGTI